MNTNIQNKKTSQVNTEDIIKAIQANSKIFRSVTGESYIKTAYDEKIYAIDSGDFETCLRKFCYYQMDGTYLPTGACAQIAGHFKMLAQSSEIKNIYRRICFKNNCIYYDLGLDGNQYYKISKDKIHVVKNDKLLFLRSNVFQRQAEPDLSGSPEDIPFYIDKYFNFSTDAEKTVFATFLVSCFFAESIAMPIINLYGEKASGKTFCEKRILDLLNPTSSGIFSLPSKTGDLEISLASDYIVAYDNISWLKEDVSNLLCINCTGGVVSRRKLFTDDTQKYLKLGAIVIFDSVRQAVTKSDLADRILAFHLNRFSQEERTPENLLLSDWKDDLPRFLGSLFLAVKGVLADEASAKYASPFRLSDFYEIAVKSAKQCGYTEDDIYYALSENVQSMNDSIIDNDIVLTAVELFMAREEMKDGYEATPAQFYTDLKLFAYEELSVRSFPRSASSLSSKLSENRHNLEMQNIFFERGRHKDRYIRLYKK